jgi:hypothetical protein
VAVVGPVEDALRWNLWHVRRIHDLSRLEDRLRLISYLYMAVRALAWQAAEAPPACNGLAETWEQSRSDLMDAGAAAVEAISLRLDGQDPTPALERGMAAVLRSAAAAPRDTHTLALAAALGDLLTDVRTGRAPGQNWRERTLAARLRQTLQSRASVRSVRALSWLPLSQSGIFPERRS